MSSTQVSGPSTSISPLTGLRERIDSRRATVAVVGLGLSYLSWEVEQRLGFGIGFVQHARSVNNRMPAYVVSWVGEALNRTGKPLLGARVLVLGLAYKAGVDDVRASPALQVIHHLIDAGADCSYHDAHVPAIDVSRRRAGDVPFANGEKERRLKSVPLNATTLAGADCVVILTAHPHVDYQAVVDAASLVFDATGATRAIRSDAVVRR